MYIMEILINFMWLPKVQVKGQNWKEEDLETSLP